MKNYIYLWLSLFCLTGTLGAQTPQTFNYQAVARDLQGTLLSGRELTVRVAILQNDGLLWQEDHTVTTNAMGLFNISIGDPNAQQSGGTANTFAAIPWADGDLLFSVSLDAGNGFESMGTSEIQAVPYALYALNGVPGPQGPPGEPASDNQTLSLTGNTLDISGGNSVDLSPLAGTNGVWGLNQDTITTFKNVGIGTSDPNLSTLTVQGLNQQTEAPLFEVRREDGFPVFAVFSDGVMVYVDEDSKARKRGFAVGGYSRSKKGLQQEYLTVTPDSVRVYVPETDQAKGAKGGFAVGGYSRTKAGPGQDLLFVNHDSTRVYVPSKGNDTPDFQGLQGGFAVTGFTPGGKGPNEYMMGINRGITRFNTSDNDQGFAIGSQSEGWGSKYLELTPTNSFIGNDAGLKNMPIDPVDPDGWGLSSMNVFVGYQAGMENLYGHHNTYLGFCAGTKTTGDNSDPEAAAHNVFIGTQAGFKNTIGSYNVEMGCYAGLENLDGWQNVFIGAKAGISGVHTSSATMVGNMAGSMYLADGEVTFLGAFAGTNNQGQYNTFLGNSAGSFSEDGSDNVYIGNQAGQYAAGNYNVVLGNDAGRGIGGNSVFDQNVLIGTQAGSFLVDGSRNTMVGNQAGMNATGSGNVFIGSNAGADETYDNQLYIDNSNTYYPLIYGDFDYDYLAIYGDLDVFGDFYAYSVTSDGGYAKSSVRELENPLDKLLSLHAVRFSTTAKGPEKSGETENKNHIGIYADEVEKVFPELVSEKRGKGKTVNYNGLVPVLLEAIKAQQAQIESLETRIAELEN